MMIESPHSQLRFIHDPTTLLSATYHPLESYVRNSDTRSPHLLRAFRGEQRLRQVLPTYHTASIALVVFAMLMATVAGGFAMHYGLKRQYLDAAVMASQLVIWAANTYTAGQWFASVRRPPPAYTYFVVVLAAASAVVAVTGEFDPLIYVTFTALDVAFDFACVAAVRQFGGFTYVDVEDDEC